MYKQQSDSVRSSLSTIFSKSSPPSNSSVTRIICLVSSNAAMNLMKSFYHGITGSYSLYYLSILSFFSSAKKQASTLPFFLSLINLAANTLPVDFSITLWTNPNPPSPSLFLSLSYLLLQFKYEFFLVWYAIFYILPEYFLVL